MAVQTYTQDELGQFVLWLTEVLAKAKTLTINRVDMNTETLGSFPTIHDWVNVRLNGPIEIDDMVGKKAVTVILRREEGDVFPVNLGAARDNFPMEAYAIRQDKVIHIISRYYAGWIMVTTIYLND